MLPERCKRRVLLASALLLLLPGCRRSQAPEEPPSSEARPARAGTPAVAPTAPSTEPRVVQADDLVLPAECAEMTECVGDYLAFIERASEHARPIDEAELERQLDSIFGENNAVSDEEPAPDELRAELLAAMNIGFLVDGIDARELRVQELSSRTLGSVTETRLLFGDPWVGTFAALLLDPGGDGPLPGIVAHPGHTESAAYHRDHRHGRALAERGYVVLILEPRASDTDRNESLVARAALLQGHTLMGMRAYEVLLAGKYLRWSPRVDPARIGLQGHSGGSVVGNLVARIDDHFAAYVSDLFSTYGIVLERSEGLLGDETAPAIYRWHGRIEDLTTARCPMIQEPYGYEDGPERMFRFFDGQLQPEGTAGP